MKPCHQRIGRRRIEGFASCRGHAAKKHQTEDALHAASEQRRGAPENQAASDDPVLLQPVTDNAGQRHHQCHREKEHGPYQAKLRVRQAQVFPNPGNHHAINRPVALVEKKRQAQQQEQLPFVVPVQRPPRGIAGRRCGRVRHLLPPECRRKPPRVRRCQCPFRNAALPPPERPSTD